MTGQITISVWLFAFLVAVVVWAILDRVLIPSTRWFLRRRINRVIDEIDHDLQLLAAHPEMGEAVDHLRPDTRRFVVKKNYLLFYDCLAGGIRLLRVLHGARLIGPEDLQI